MNSSPQPLRNMDKAALPPSSKRTSVDVNVNHGSGNESSGRTSLTPTASSPTGVNDARLFQIENSETTNTEADEHDQTKFLSIVPVEKIRQQFVESYIFVHHFVEDQKQNFVLDRKAIATMILSFLASIAACLGVALASLGGLLVVSCPLWLPVVILTLPLWLPLMLFTSPVWLSVTATLFACLGGTCAFILSITFFFTWPEEWLPAKESSSIVTGFLHYRDAATLSLAKVQAKFLLYAAGIGPAADVIFVVLDRVDVQALLKKLQHVDWEDLGTKVRRGQLQDIQRILVEIAQSMFR